MKQNSRILAGLTAMALVLALGISAVKAETAAADPAATQTAEAAVQQSAAPDTTTSATTKRGMPSSGTGTQQLTEEQQALQAALEAYATAQRDMQLTLLESELKQMVESGKLTQEQSDLVLQYYKDRAANGQGFGLGFGTGRQDGMGLGIGSGGHGNGMGGKGRR